MVAMLWANQIMLNKKKFKDVPLLLKEQVAQILIDAGYEELVTDPNYWANQIILGNQQFINVPLAVKEQVRQILIDQGYEELTEEEVEEPPIEPEPPIEETPNN